MSRRGSTPLDFQFREAICNQFELYSDKHSYKAQNGHKMDEKIFGAETKRGLLDVSKNFCNFLKENYKDDDRVKYARDIKAEHVNAWLEKRSETCTDATLDKYARDFKKIEFCLNKQFPSCNLKQHQHVVVPESKKMESGASKGVENQMTKEQYDKIQERGLTSKSQAYIALQVVYETGLRIQEVEKLTPADLKNFEKINAGYKDMKHGKVLQEDKPLSKELSEKLKKFSEGKQSNERIFDIKAKSMQREMDRVSVRLGYDTKRTYHNCRSLYGQMIYDNCRKQGLSNKESLLVASKALNHESVRSMLEECYIKTY